MGFNYRDLSKKTKKTHIDLEDGDTIAFEFRHQLITPRLVADMTALDALEDSKPQEASAKLLAISEHVARLVTKWDVLDEDDSMFPLDAARLAVDIPLEIQMRILMKAVEEMRSTGEATPEPAV